MIVCGSQNSVGKIQNVGKTKGPAFAGPFALKVIAPTKTAALGRFFLDH